MVAFLSSHFIISDVVAAGFHTKNSANPGTVFWYSISIHLPLSDRITGIQLIISALLGDEFIVVAALDDAALFQNHDAVTVLDLSLIHI